MLRVRAVGHPAGKDAQGFKLLRLAQLLFQVTPLFVAALVLREGMFRTGQGMAKIDCGLGGGLAQTQ